MISAVRDFIDRLRVQSVPPPVDVSAISPELHRQFQSDFKASTRAMADLANQMEDSFDRLYDAGADDADAIERLDCATEIIRRPDLTDAQRLQELGRLFLTV